MTRPLHYTSFTQQLAYTVRDASTGIVTMLLASIPLAHLLQTYGHMDKSLLTIMGIICGLSFVPYLLGAALIIVITSHSLREMYQRATNDEDADTAPETETPAHDTTSQNYGRELSSLLNQR